MADAECPLNDIVTLAGSVMAERSGAPSDPAFIDLVRYLTLPELLEPPAATLMSRPFVSCAPDDDVHTVWQTMAAQDLQNVPVLSADAKPIGVLDIRDAMKMLFEQEELQEHLLVNYIAGIGYR